MNKKVLITGGLGFIFSHVTEYFVRQGYEVTVIDNCSTGSHLEVVDGSFTFLKEDFAQPSGWKLVLEAKPQWFIHAAGITDVDHAIAHSEEVMFNNIMCNLNAFEAVRQCQGLEKFLYVGTDEVYGECTYRKRETDIIFPRNPYSCSKAVGSLMRYAYDNTYTNLFEKTAEIRMCNIFGPRQDTRKILPQIIQGIREGYSVPLQNGGEGYREYLYVENIPQLVELVMQKGWRTYNVTLNDGFTVLELIRKVEGLTGRKVLYHKSERQGHDRFYRMDNFRVTQELGWKPLYSFEEGLKKYIGGSLSSS